MVIKNLNQGVPKLTEGQSKALALKLEAFWSELSPAEQAHVNLALGRMADDTSDVSGHASMAEYGLLLSLIAILLKSIVWVVPFTKTGHLDQKGGLTMKRYYLRLARYVASLATLIGFRLAAN